MTRDPTYNQILTALARPLDAEAFERAAVDLLRSDYSLVPVRGGQDGGMDGAISDDEREAYPLVTTTSAKLVANLKKNLASYISTGRPRRVVVFATSQEVNAKKRRTLETAATAMGFTLRQIHARSDFADRLLRDTRWRNELLGITGEASALSFLPRSSRSDANVALIGRDDDIRWALDSKRDGLLLGQPGSGKTSILREVAKRNGGLFVVDSDPTRIANAIREQSPRILIIDDAHLTPGLALSLRHLRQQIRANYSILAASWPGERDPLAAELEANDESIRELSLLRRKEIVQIINAAGVGGPDDLLHELVRQAEGRPGLAVTLARLCLQKGVWDVVMGRSLLQNLKASLIPIIGRDAVTVLGVLAASGDSGMSLETVSEILHMDLARVNDVVTRLALAGVVLQTAKNQMAVRPSALQFALVRETFFNGPAVLSVEPILARVPDHDSAAVAFLGAAAREATVPWQLQTSLLAKAQTDDAWRLFASISREHTNYALETYPEKIDVIVREALSHAAEKTLPLLFQKMIGDARAPHSHPHIPQRVIQDWIKSGYPGTPAPLENRRLLLRSAEKWLRDKKDYSVGLWAAFYSLTPNYEANRMSPSDELTYIMTYGFLPEQQMRDLAGEWPRVRAIVEVDRITSWGQFIECFWHWAHPSMGADKLSQSALSFMREFAATMLKELTVLAVKRSGFVAWARQHAKGCDCVIDQSPDTAYSIFFPDLPDDNYEEHMVRQREAARALAAEWRTLSPEDIFLRVHEFEQEAASVGNSWSPQVRDFCEALAERSTRRFDWVRFLIAQKAGNTWVHPFLRETVAQEENGWEELAAECLGDPLTQWSALDILLSRPVIPPALIEPVSTILPKQAESVRTLCLQRRVPAATLQWLLESESAAVAAAAVRGTWEAPKSRGTVPEELRPLWRAAFIRTINGEHPAEDILRSDPSLRFEWLAARIVRGAETFWRYDAAAAVASSQLTTQERIALLKLISGSHHILQAVPNLVGRDLGAFAALLSQSQLESSHLEPLSGKPDEQWAAMAKLAVDAGHTIEEVARAVIGHSWGWSGAESAFWLGWKTEFDGLCQHQDDQVRAIGQAGRDWAEGNRSRAAKIEHDRAVRGG